MAREKRNLKGSKKLKKDLNDQEELRDLNDTQENLNEDLKDLEKDEELKQLEALLSILHKGNTRDFTIITQSTTEQSYYYGPTIPISNVASRFNDSTSERYPQLGSCF